MAEKSYMPYLAIVVLVAVVAVVVLVLNAKPASEEAVAGGATRFSYLRAPEVLDMFERATIVVRNRGAQPYLDCNGICGLGQECIDAYESYKEGELRPIACRSPDDAPVPLETPAIICRCARAVQTISVK